MKKIVIKTCFLCPYYISTIYTVAMGNSRCTHANRWFNTHEGHRIPEWCSLEEEGTKSVKIVKIQSWSYVYWSEDKKRVYGGVNCYKTEEEARNRGIVHFKDRFIKTVLIHEWEGEEEK